MALTSGVNRQQAATRQTALGGGGGGALVNQRTPPPPGGLGGLPRPPGFIPTRTDIGGGAPATLGGPPSGLPAPGGPTQQFGPGSNLIGTQFNPTASGRLGGTQGQVNTAQNAVAGFQPGQFQGIGAGTAPGGLDAARTAAEGAQVGQLGTIGGPQFGGARDLLGQAATQTGSATVGPFAGIGGGTFGPQSDTASARAGITQDLGALRGAPNRGELAAQNFDLIQQRGAPQFQRELRDVGARAASLGRVGAGVTTNELTDVFTQRQRDLDQVRSGLALDSAGREFGDRFNQLQASQGVAGQLFGQDIGDASFQQGLRGEARGERGFQAGQAGDEATRALQRASQLSGLGAQEAGLASQEFGAQFGERGFQSGQEQRQADNAARQAGLFSGLQGQQFGQEQSLRGEQRGERQAGQDFDFRNFAAQQSQLGQLSGLEGQQFGQEQSARNELRGERGFQTALDQQGIQNAVQQRQLEEALLSGQFGRDFDTNRFLADLGFNNNSVANFGNQASRSADRFSRQADASNAANAAAIRAAAGGF